ncbi:hypothetical protein TREMEDRAFT_30731, partial [Tremella mesenterica DSM 1558]|uniref:uncharacterized protein n=1 Tax=Tremella mesenterica (strain ATCC 24925 / CBS 8224 / DSM 1558 / NBRC 9311 / NRRL Y-6157 / RJB 2259-6 / UBC 559-6) TaxID=578456 RepID=UPI0003F495A5
HKLNAEFAERFIIGDQLGFGGYGFVVSAIDLFATHQNEVHVAVKFVFKSRMEESDKAEMVDKLPKEAYVLSQVRHPGIILLLAVYEDEKFYYYVTELHGDSWRKGAKTIEGQHYLEYLALSKRPSQLPIFPEGHFNPPIAQHVSSRRTQPRRKDEEKNLNERTVPPQMIHTNSQEKPNMERRPSYDLFECCEHVRFTDDQAKNIFRQIVQAVAYLHMRGIYHRDLKDENIVIDRYLRVKLIDFGSAVLEDDFDNPIQYSMYRGTAAYAPPEISRGMYYEAAKCDVWALGVILSILLTGSVPFPHVNDAEAGRMVLKRPISKQAESLMRLCLTVEAEERPNIWKVKAHPWLRQVPLVF